MHLGINITELLVIKDITSLYILLLYYPYIWDNTVIQVYTIHSLHFWSQDYLSGLLCFAYARCPRNQQSTGIAFSQSCVGMGTETQYLIGLGAKL